MEKPASTDFPVLDLIRNRWSPRAFDPTRQISPQQARSLLEAARWAPSCFNEQPWRFVVALKQNPNAFSKVVDCLASANQKWAPAASLLALTFGATKFSHNGNPNRHAWHDCGLALAQLILQAESMGLRAHVMAGIERERIREDFQTPKDVQPIAALAVGFPGPMDNLDDDVRAKEELPRNRKPQNDWVFGVEWGRAWQGD